MHRERERERERENAYENRNEWERNHAATTFIFSEMSYLIEYKLIEFY